MHRNALRILRKRNLMETYATIRRSSSNFDLSSSATWHETNWRAWAEAQHKFTVQVLFGERGLQGAPPALMGRYPTHRVSIPKKVGQSTYFSVEDSKDGTRIYRRTGVLGADVECFDSSALGVGYSQVLLWWMPSADERHLALLASQAGTDTCSLFVTALDVPNECRLLERNLWFPSAVWDGVRSVLYLAVNEKSGSGEEHGKAQGSIVRRDLDHLEDDGQLVLSVGSSESITVMRPSGDPRFLILETHFQKYYRNGLYLFDISLGRVSTIYEENIVESHGIGIAHGRFYFERVDETGITSLVARGLPEFASEKEITIFEENNTEFLKEVTLTKDYLVLNLLRDSTNLLRIYDIDGQVKDEFLPSQPRSIGLGDSNERDNETFVSVEGFERSRGIESVALFPRLSCRPFKPALAIEEEIEIRADVMYSFDGERIHLFFIEPRGISSDSRLPTVINAYGGFGIPQMPRWRPEIHEWILRGGRYVVAGVRGGGEYGRRWHNLGKGKKKRDCVEDVCCVARWLIERGLSNREGLGLRGSSNGGWLVSATALLYPELFGAVVASVPLTDLLALHKDSVTRYYLADFGDVTEADTREALRNISPVHIVQSQQYPPILIIASDNDDRVPISHPLRLLASLQKSEGGENLALLFLHESTGHGQFAGMIHEIREASVVTCFFEEALGV